MPLEAYIACPTTRDFSVPTMLSFLNTQEWCFRNGVKVEIVIVTGSLVHHARIIAANRFLASGFSHLFFIDSDVVWEPEDFAKVLLQAQKKDCVVGIYPRRCDGGEFFLRFAGSPEPSEDGMLEISGTGLGFACIQRRVVEELSWVAPKRQCCGVSQPSIFRQDDDGNELRGEDYAFWADVKKQGFQVWADTTVAVGHVGQKVFYTAWKEKVKDGTTSQSAEQ